MEIKVELLDEGLIGANLTEAKLFEVSYKDRDGDEVNRLYRVNVGWSVYPFSKEVRERYWDEPIQQGIKALSLAEESEEDVTKTLFKEVSAFGKVTDTCTAIIKNEVARTLRYVQPEPAVSYFLEMANSIGLDYDKRSEVNSRMCNLFFPEFANPFNGTIQIYTTHSDLARNRKSSMKLGRAIRLMFDDITDKQVETLVDNCRKRYEKRDLIIEVGLKREDFRMAYELETLEYRNPHITQMRKNLAQSCMHADKYVTPEDSDYADEDGYMHPAEVYASGDFEIVMALTPDRKQIAARSIVYTNNIKYDERGNPVDCPVASPIYGVCEYSIDLVEKFLLDSYYDPEILNRRYWDGARLLAIPLEYDDGFVGPYTDIGESCDHVDGFLQFSDYGELSTQNTDGTIGVQGCICEYCDDHFNSEYEGAYVDCVGHVCEYCINNSFVWSEYNETYIEADESREAVINNCGETCFFDWNDDSIVECVHEDETYWLKSLCHFNELIDAWVPDTEVDSEYYVEIYQEYCDMTETNSVFEIEDYEEDHLKCLDKMFNKAISEVESISHPAVPIQSLIKEFKEAYVGDNNNDTTDSSQ